MTTPRGESERCWKRARLILFWLVSLTTLLLAFRGNAGLLAFLLVWLGAAIRPGKLEDQTERQRLASAFSLLLVLPAIAIILGSPAARAFLRTGPGLSVIFAVWALFTVADLRFYRSLPPFQRECAAPE